MLDFKKIEGHTYQSPADDKNMFSGASLNSGTKQEHSPVISYGNETDQSREIAFTTDYEQSRKNFLAAAKEANATVVSFDLLREGLNGEKLHMDFATIGNKQPKKGLFLLAGEHAAAGFLGSRNQIAFLKSKPQVTDDSVGITLYHGHSPMAMSYLNRSEINLAGHMVDANRNMHIDPSLFTQESPAYDKLNSFINPKFRRYLPVITLIESVYQVITKGQDEVTNAITKGQHNHPEGMYYGGRRLVESNEILKKYIEENYQNCKTFIGSDLHTGMINPPNSNPIHNDFSHFVSTSNPDSKLWESFSNITKHSHALRVEGSIENSSAVENSGGVSDGIRQLLPKNTKFLWVQQEVQSKKSSKNGLISMLRSISLFHKLRELAIAERKNPALPKTHPTKVALQKAMSPNHPEWRQEISESSLELYKALASLTR